MSKLLKVLQSESVNVPSSASALLKTLQDLKIIEYGNGKLLKFSLKTILQSRLLKPFDEYKIFSERYRELLNNSNF